MLSHYNFDCECKEYDNICTLSVSTENMLYKQLRKQTREHALMNQLNIYQKCFVALLLSLYRR